MLEIYLLPAENLFSKLWETVGDSPTMGRIRHAFETSQVPSTPQDYQKLYWLLFFLQSPSTLVNPKHHCIPQTDQCHSRKRAGNHQITSDHSLSLEV